MVQVGRQAVGGARLVAELQAPGLVDNRPESPGPGVFPQLVGLGSADVQVGASVGVEVAHAPAGGRAAGDHRAGRRLGEPLLGPPPQQACLVPQLEDVGAPVAVPVGRDARRARAAGFAASPVAGKRRDGAAAGVPGEHVRPVRADQQAGRAVVAGAQRRQRAAPARPPRLPQATQRREAAVLPPQPHVQARPVPARQVAPPVPVQVHQREGHRRRVQSGGLRPVHQPLPGAVAGEEAVASRRGDEQPRLAALCAAQPGHLRHRAGQTRHTQAPPPRHARRYGHVGVFVVEKVPAHLDQLVGCARVRLLHPLVVEHVDAPFPGPGAAEPHPHAAEQQVAFLVGLEDNRLGPDARAQELAGVAGLPGVGRGERQTQVPRLLALEHAPLGERPALVRLVLAEPAGDDPPGALHQVHRGEGGVDHGVDRAAARPEQTCRQDECGASPGRRWSPGAHLSEPAGPAAAPQAAASAAPRCPCPAERAA